MRMSHLFGRTLRQTQLNDRRDRELVTPRRAST